MQSDEFRSYPLLAKTTFFTHSRYKINFTEIIKVII